MPIISEDELAEHVKTGEIRNFTVDTNIFYQKRFNLFTYPLSDILNIHSNISFHIPDIIYNEIVKNCIQYTTELYEKSRSSAKKMPRFKECEDAHRVISSINVEKLCKDNIDKFFSPKEKFLIPSDEYAKITRVFDRFFSTQAPFESKAEKKSEFPDAFALDTLESWAQAAEINVLVISDDGGWFNYCENSSNLFMLDSSKNKKYDILARCISQLKTLHQHYSTLTSQIEEFFSKDESEDAKKLIEEAINEFLDDSTNIEAEAQSAYYYEYEIIDAELEEVNYENAIYDISENLSQAIIARCTIPIKFNCTASFYIHVWDSEDKEYIHIDTKEISAHGETDMQLDFHLSPNEQYDIDAESFMEAEVFSDPILVDFGEF